MILRAGHHLRLARLANRCAGLDVFAGKNFVGIEPDAAADAPCPFASVTERQAQRIIRHARLHPNRTADAPAVQRDFHQVAVLHAEFARRFAADEHGVVPSHLGDRIGQFLHPAVVRETAIIHLCVAEENDFEVGCGRRGDILNSRHGSSGRLAPRFWTQNPPEIH